MSLATDARASATHLLAAMVVLVVVMVSLMPTAMASGAVSHGSRERHWVALTFDDGWSVERCAQIATTLRRKGVTATFFPNGTYVRRAPARWRRVLRGFAIANHTLSHAWLDGLSSTGIRREISANEAVIERALGRRMLHLLRPPYGAYDAEVLRVAGSLGYRTVLWDVDSYDTSSSSPLAVASNASRGINGSIVLLHCGPAATPAAVGAIIDSYRARGFRFVDLATMLGLGSARPAMACRVRNARTGKTKRSLRKAVRAARAGDHLVLRGTCRGTTTIGKDLSLKGTRTKRSRAPTLAGMDRGPVLTILARANVSVTGLTIRGGAADRAAGILNLGRLTLRDVVVRGNEAREAAGGIANHGHLELLGKTLVRGNSSGGHSGGIVNWGTLVVGYGARIARNRAATAGGGLSNRGTVKAPGCGHKIHDNVPEDCVGT